MWFGDDRLPPRFWLKVRLTESCWEWDGGLAGNGYGSFRWLGKSVGPHRLVLELTEGDGAGLYACHECDNPICVRTGPGHLRWDTQTENMREMWARGRREREQMAT